MSNNESRKWIVGEPGGPSGPFYSVIKSSGIVIALQIPQKETAELIASIPLLKATARAANALSDAIAEFGADPVAIGESVQALDYWLAKLGYTVE